YHRLMQFPSFLFSSPCAYRDPPSFLHDALPILRGGLDRELAQGLARDLGLVPAEGLDQVRPALGDAPDEHVPRGVVVLVGLRVRSEEHTSELQSRENLVCRLLLEKKKQDVQQVE